MTLRRAALIWCVLALAAALALAASLMLGSVRVPAGALLDLLRGRVDGLAGGVVLDLRLPRALSAFACGGLLALAGALMQVLLRNPLADPYVLGVSGGAGVFALLALLLALPAIWVQASAFVGALLAISLVMALARQDFLRADSIDGSPRLLLTGVVLATGWGAAAALILTLAPDAGLRGMLFWLTGDLNGASHGWPAVAVLALLLLVSYPSAHRLNALLRGETVAQSVGVAVAPLRLRIYLVASLATAVAVTTAGAIGFVGLVIPHMLRLAFGNDQRMLLPAAVLGGGTLLMAADLAARTVIAPAQLPVGIITALVGVPVFLWLLLLRRGR